MGASRLGALLVEEGILTETDRRTIRRTSGSHSSSFAKSIISIGLLDEDELAAFLAERTSHEVAPKSMADNVDLAMLSAIDRPLLERLEVIPLRVDGSLLTVAMADPLDTDTIMQLRFFTGYRINPVIATFSQIKNAMEQLLGQDFKPTSSHLSDFLSNHVLSASRHFTTREGLIKLDTTPTIPAADTSPPIQDSAAADDDEDFSDLDSLDGFEDASNDGAQTSADDDLGDLGDLDDLEDSAPSQKADASGDELGDLDDDLGDLDDDDELGSEPETAPDSLEAAADDSLGDDLDMLSDEEGEVGEAAATPDEDDDLAALSGDLDELATEDAVEEPAPEDTLAAADGDDDLDQLADDIEGAADTPEPAPPPEETAAASDDADPMDMDLNDIDAEIAAADDEPAADAPDDAAAPDMAAAAESDIEDGGDDPFSGLDAAEESSDDGFDLAGEAESAAADEPEADDSLDLASEDEAATGDDLDLAAEADDTANTDDSLELASEDEAAIGDDLDLASEEDDAAQGAQLDDDLDLADVGDDAAVEDAPAEDDLDLAGEVGDTAVDDPEVEDGLDLSAEEGDQAADETDDGDDLDLASELEDTAPSDDLSASDTDANDQDAGDDLDLDAELADEGDDQPAVTGPAKTPAGLPDRFNELAKLNEGLLRLSFAADKAAALKLAAERAALIGGHTGILIQTGETPTIAASWRQQGDDLDLENAAAEVVLGDGVTAAMARLQDSWIALESESRADDFTALRQWSGSEDGTLYGLKAEGAEGSVAVLMMAGDDFLQHEPVAKACAALLGQLAKKQ